VGSAVIVVYLTTDDPLYLPAIARVRAGFDFGTTDETERFLTWFERMFLAQAVVPERWGAQ